MSAKFYTLSAKNIDGTQTSLEEWQGKVVLIVNVASRCGFTNQYEGLEALQKKYADKGFSVLGFPCNQFGAQEPGTEDEIKSFCETTFGVSFPLFSKVDVNGSDTHPVYEYLKEELPGALGTKAIKWNFTKFLIDKEGNPIKRYAPQDKPADLEKDIAKLL
ncbi:MAG: glutathione peroxidase [Halobacteriovorax sp.]|nr:glutathione peroxidase [Halobacteriovorax sp.]|tara:strand:+ start:817 stop:1299 length:483 start_codon:yes stop_codon:yes gene_type:complete